MLGIFHMGIGQYVRTKWVWLRVRRRRRKRRRRQQKQQQQQKCIVTLENEQTYWRTNERTIDRMSEQTKIHAYVLLLTWLHCKASRCIVRTHICVWSASSSSSTAVEWEKRKISIFNRYLTLYTSVLCKQTVLYLESNRFCLNNKYFKRHRYVILVWLIVCYGQPERSTSFFFLFLINLLL